MGAFLDVPLQDIRFGLRSLCQSKPCTAVIVISLGKGIGANTVMFSLVNGLLLRSISLVHPESLMRLRWAGPADFTGMIDTGLPDTVTGHDLRTNFSRLIFERLRTDDRALTDLFATSLHQVILHHSHWEPGYRTPVLCGRSRLPHRGGERRPILPGLHCRRTGVCGLGHKLHRTAEPNRHHSERLRGHNRRIARTRFGDQRGTEY